MSAISSLNVHNCSHSIAFSAKSTLDLLREYWVDSSILFDRILDNTRWLVLDAYNSSTYGRPQISDRLVSLRTYKLGLVPRVIPLVIVVWGTIHCDPILPSSKSDPRMNKKIFDDILSNSQNYVNRSFSWSFLITLQFGLLWSVQPNCDLIMSKPFPSNLCYPTHMISHNWSLPIMRSTSCGTQNWRSTKVIWGGTWIADSDIRKLGMLEVILSINRHVREVWNPMHLETRFGADSRIGSLASVAPTSEITARHSLSHLCRP